MLSRQGRDVFETHCPAFGQERLFFLANELSAYPIGAADKNKCRQTNSCNWPRCCNCPPARAGSTKAMKPAARPAIRIRVMMLLPNAYSIEGSTLRVGQSNGFGRFQYCFPSTVAELHQGSLACSRVLLMPTPVLRSRILDVSCEHSEL
jgi:hypothetical protein